MDIKTLPSRIADGFTAIVVALLGAGMVGAGFSMFWAELHSPSGVAPERSLLIIVILVVVAVLCGYAAHRFMRNVFFPSEPTT